MKLFQGRINRKTYVVGSIIVFIVSILIVLYAISSAGKFNLGFDIFILFIFLVNIAFFISLRVRRAHDIGQSFIRTVPQIAANFWEYQEGEKKSNKYGESPNNDKRNLVKKLFNLD